MSSSSGQERRRPRDVYRVRDIADMLEVQESTVRGYVSRGSMPPPDGHDYGSWWWPPTIDRWVETRAQHKPRRRPTHRGRDLTPEQTARLQTATSPQEWNQVAAQLIDDGTAAAAIERATGVRAMTVIARARRARRDQP